LSQWPRLPPYQTAGVPVAVMSATIAPPPST